MKTPLKQPYKQFFGTLANQIRIDILSLLTQKSMNVSTLVQQLSYDQSSISHSLRRLEECGFVSVEAKGKERFYTLNHKTIEPLFSLMNMHVHKYCRHVVAKKKAR